MVFRHRGGKKEILYRRIGRNEMSAIRVCQELVAAQKEYYSTQHDEYAQKIFSDEGSTMAFIGKLPRANPRVPSGRWWHRPSLRAMPKAKTALRLLTADTISTS